MTISPNEFVEKVWAWQQMEGAVRVVARKNWDANPDEEDWDERPVPAQRPLPDMSQQPDWYFAPCLFTGRRKQHLALPSRLLYADLDAVDPSSITNVSPTIAWETSPKSYQALWVLDRPLAVVKSDGSPGPFEDVNRRLTYHVGADKGGWSSTKVLRPVGSISTKYGKSRAKRFTVRLCFKGKKWRLEDLQQLLSDTQVSSTQVSGREWADLPQLDDVLTKWKHKFPTRAKTLLRAPQGRTAGEDRSARLWELHMLLLETGMAPEEVLVVSRGSAWNKFKGQRREMQQLRTEVAKATEVARGQAVERGRLDRVRQGASERSSSGVSSRLQRAYQSRKESVGLGYFTFGEFMEAKFPEPEWLVEGFWGKTAYGIWAGEFKAYKTVTLLDFCLSVASGKPFLGRFQVCAPGGVLYAHDEGTPGLIQNRLWRIASSKGLAASVERNGAGHFELTMPKSLPHLHISTWPQLNLLEEESQVALDSYCSMTKPRVVVLESFYLMARDVDENSSHEVMPALSFLKDLAHSHGVAIIISHHYNKGAGDDGKKKRPGLRVSGSGVFGRWYESAVYLERQGEDEDNRTIISAEHREQVGSGRMGLHVQMNSENENHYAIEILGADMKVSGPSDLTEATGDVEDLVARSTVERPKSDSTGGKRLGRYQNGKPR